jgi:hypothetical protein
VAASAASPQDFVPLATSPPQCCFLQCYCGASEDCTGASRCVWCSVAQDAVVLERVEWKKVSSSTFLPRLCQWSMVELRSEQCGVAPRPMCPNGDGPGVRVRPLERLTKQVFCEALAWILGFWFFGVFFSGGSQGGGGDPDRCRSASTGSFKDGFVTFFSSGAFVQLIQDTCVSGLFFRSPACVVIWLF